MQCAKTSSKLRSSVLFLNTWFSLASPKLRNTKYWSTVNPLLDGPSLLAVLPRCVLSRAQLALLEPKNIPARKKQEGAETPARAKIRAENAHESQTARETARRALLSRGWRKKMPAVQPLAANKMNFSASVSPRAAVRPETVEPCCYILKSTFETHRFLRRSLNDRRLEKIRDMHTHVSLYLDLRNPVRVREDLIRHTQVSLYRNIQLCKRPEKSTAHFAATIYDTIGLCP